MPLCVASLVLNVYEMMSNQVAPEEQTFWRNYVLGANMDGDENVLQDHFATKLVLFIVMVAGLVGGGAYSAIWYNFGLKWPALAAAGLSLNFAVTLVVLCAKRVLLALQLCTMGAALWLAAIHISFGAGAASGGILSSAYCGPFLMLLLEPSNRKAVVMLVILFVFSLITCITEQAFGQFGHDQLTQQRTELPPRIYAVCLWININVSAIFLFAVLSVAVAQLQHSRQTLQASNRRVERLNRTLKQREHKLELERRLAHKLISNMFPETISAPLTEIFEGFAEGLEDVDRYELSTWMRTNMPKRKSTAETVCQAALLPKGGLELRLPYETGMVAERSESESTACAGDSNTCSDSSELMDATRHVFEKVDRSLAPKEHKMATILFADIVGFTHMASQMDAASLVQFLDQFFGQVDDACREEEVEKIKTIGDCYMCVGWTEEGGDPAASTAAVLAVAREMHRIIHRTLVHGKRLAIRAGVHVGPVVSGIIGKSKFVFDIWGDAVNVASRMESTGLPGVTQVSADVYELIPDKEQFTWRGHLDVKGKGKLLTYITTPVLDVLNIEDLTPPKRTVSNPVQILVKLMHEVRSLLDVGDGEVAGRS